MREALEADLRAVLNGALNMLGTVERMLPVAAEVLALVFLPAMITVWLRRRHGMSR